MSGKTNAKLLTSSRLLAATLSIAVAASTASAIRIKDITTVEGVRTNNLRGVGLVVGLDGTGGQGPGTRQVLLNFLQREGLRADPATRLGIANNTQIKTENMALVAVFAELPTFVRKGKKIDVVCAAIDAKSLKGGQLIGTALRGVDGEVYAMARGPIALGGFSAKGQGASVKVNHPTRGHIVGGATVEREVDFAPGVGGTVRLHLRDADFETASRIVKAINLSFPGTSRAIDAGTVDVIVPPEYRLDTVGFVGRIHLLEVQPDTVAQVVIDESTGTIVFGENVRIADVAINHGNLTIVTAETPRVSQPAPLSQGATVVVPQTQLQAQEERSPVALLEATTTIGDLARALNALGVTPRDLSSIFRQLHASNAIYADVVFK
ncbi:MAG: flagellar basal body P-ring protein FlgI [Planctomycetales bacterium]|nr:flagellar basal body P-ring protein FlgI [Planctomycetales bacterium]